MIFPQWVEPKEQNAEQDNDFLNARDVDFFVTSSLGKVTIKSSDSDLMNAFQDIMNKIAEKSQHKSILDSIILDSKSIKNNIKGKKIDLQIIDEVINKSPKYIDDYKNNPQFSISTIVPPSETMVDEDSETSINKAKSEQQHNFNNAVQSLLKKVKDDSLLNFHPQESFSATLLVGFDNSPIENEYEVIADTKNGIYPDGFIAMSHICHHYNISPVNISDIKVEKHIHSDSIKITLNGFAEQYLKWDS